MNKFYNVHWLNENKTERWMAKTPVEAFERSLFNRLGSIDWRILATASGLHMAVINNPMDLDATVVEVDPATGEVINAQ